ncbi:hypothetical protein A1O3_09838 [Capronia epimyces CBS 606.96]|uniref:AB hydrolase-1 domain-containing protein n=1 Tax=Capronia epimyces CBS 606.96 TaxID=1182542 RepID=W9XKV9_9EURO|nr:uncharacterized protein A1O3_09838 [Capronia epimyces CBS 606.96]EXJ77611.1 hypothetical protein A1O3_09838 [Capronia epimyces CBS 606.96]
MAAAKISTSTVVMDDGVKLYVKFHGDVSDTTKPLIIGLHGGPGLGNHTALDGTLGDLASSFRVLVYDARGSGVSDLVGPYTHERWIKDIENLRIWAGAETFVLAGHSYGGFIALDYAISHPNRLSGLILIDTWTVGTLGQMGALANILTSDRVQNVDKDRQLRIWSGNLLSDQDYQDGITEILAFYSPPDEEGAPKKPATPAPMPADLFGPHKPFHIHYETQNWAFGWNLPRFDVRKKLKDIKASPSLSRPTLTRSPALVFPLPCGVVPTLITVGRHDQVTPVSFALELEKGIPNSRLEIFEHSSHSPYVDEPDKFRDVLLDFVKSKVL